MLEESTVEVGSTGAPAPAARPSGRSGRALVVLLLGIIAAMLAYDLWASRVAAAAPGEQSAEVGFARDMMQHHAQAVAMATLELDRTDDPELRQLALDIVLTQQAQIGQMQGWLAIWGRPVASTGPAMAWMGMPTTGPMPGMATADDVNRLRDLRGREADELFLRLMIAHHRGGVAMARAALDRVRRPEVRALAESIVAGQQSEIDLMQALRQRLGFPPVPETAPMAHD